MMRQLLTTIILAAAAACGSDAGTGPVPTSVVGTFDITTYNGSALPAYLEPKLGACSSMLVGGTLTTREDGRVTFARSYSTPCLANSPPVTEARDGTLSVDGTTITVTLDANVLNATQVFTGTVAGGQITLHYTVPNRVEPLEQTFVLARR